MFFLNIKCSIAADKEYLMIKKSALASYYSLIEKHNYISALLTPFKYSKNYKKSLIWHGTISTKTLKNKL